jgi:hypothetical protein
MSIPTFEIVVLLAALCGLVMVAGGIFLLYRGAITLAATPQTNAISIEFRRLFRINTQVPGIAFFLIGLLFVSIALQMSKPPEVSPIDLLGEVPGVSVPVTVVISAKWTLESHTTGTIKSRFYPDTSTLTFMATAPGYLPFSAPLDLNAMHGRVAKIGKVKMEKKVDEIAPNKANISAVSFDTPPVANTGSFGVSQ